MKNWYKLDNAAKLFPATAEITNTSIYRISYILKEQVNPELLQTALDEVIKRYPTLAVEIKAGFFWNFLNKNERKLKVQPEESYPCSPIIDYQNNNYLIRVIYFNKRVSIEVFHALTDGYGAIQFLNTLIYQYLTLQGHEINSEDKILLPNEVPPLYEEEDSFSKYYHNKKTKKIKNKKAFRLHGTKFEPYGNSVIHGVVDADKIKQIAKEKGMTVNEYLVTLLIYSIYSESMRYAYKNDPIVICVPVNLRKMFPSKTIRNFFGVANLEVPCKADMTFEEIGEIVKKEAAEKTTKEYLENVIFSNLKLEKSVLIKIIPLVIKNVFVKYGFETWSENKKTMTLSNLGKIELPKDMNVHVDNMEVLLYPTLKAPINASAITINNKLTISFVKTIRETEIIKYFFRYLANNCNLEVTTYGNEWGNENE